MDLAEKVDKGSASVSYKKLSDKFADLMAKRNVQHALLAMRGPGALLGDDSLR